MAARCINDRVLYGEWKFYVLCDDAIYFEDSSVLKIHAVLFFSADYPFTSLVLYNQWHGLWVEQPINFYPLIKGRFALSVSIKAVTFRFIWVIHI